MYWNVMIINSNLLSISVESFCGTQGFPFCCSHRRSSQKNLFPHQTPYESSLHVSSGEHSGRGQNYPLAMQMASLRHGSDYGERLPQVNVLSRSPHGNSMGMSFLIWTAYRKTGTNNALLCPERILQLWKAQPCICLYLGAEEFFLFFFLEVVQMFY